MNYSPFKKFSRLRAAKVVLFVIVEASWMQLGLASRMPDSKILILTKKDIDETSFTKKKQSFFGVPFELTVCVNRLTAMFLNSSIINWIGISVWSISLIP